MKILIFSHLYPNDFDPFKGIFVAERVRFLSKHCEIKIVAPIPFFPRIRIFRKWYKYSKIPKFELKDGIEVYHPRFLLFPKNILRNAIGTFLFLSTYRITKGLHSKWQFDLIHAHFISPSGIAASLLGKKLNIPVIITEHYGKLNVDLKKRGMRKKIDRTFEDIKHLIVVSERLRNNLLDNGFASNKISIIPNGVDIKRFQLILPEKEKIKHIKLITIGHLIESKGYQYLIKAIRILIDGNINVKLQIIGEGDYRTSLESLIMDLQLADNISLLGYISHDEIYKYINDSHIYIHPSLSESFGIAVIEALAAGLPVIVSKSGGPEYFVNKTVGIIVEKENPYQLFLAIEKIINNYSNYNPVAIREYCIKNFDYEIIISKIILIYKEVIKG